MNDILPTPINKKRIKKVLPCFLLLFSFLPKILNITCFTPLRFILENNALYKGTAISITVEYISDLFELVSFGTVCALIIFSLVLLKAKHTALITLFYFGMIILEIPARILMNVPIYGTIGEANEIIADLIVLSAYFLIQAVQFLIVFFIALAIAKSYKRSIMLLSSQKKKSSAVVEHILPIKKFINWYNPLLRSAVYSSITIIVFNMLGRLITDIEYGAPTSFGEVMIMTVNYLADAIYGFAAYVIAIIVFNLLFEKLARESKKSEEKNKEDEEISSSLFDN